MGELFQISLKPVSVDKKTRNAYRKSQLPSFKYVIDKAPRWEFSNEIMMRLPWDPKISFPYGVDPSYVQNEDDEEENDQTT